MERNYAFDGARGLAAIAVVAYHIGHNVGLPLVPSGYLAVDFFFILSGYVIEKAYTRRLADGLTFLEFAKARIIRLYPLFALGLALGLVRSLGAIAIGDHRAVDAPTLFLQVLLNSLLLPAQIGSDGIFPLNTPAWSLSLEVAINLIFAAVLFKFPRHWLVAICFAGAIGMAVGATYFGSMDQGWNVSSYWVGVCRVTFGFTAGVLLARLNARHSGQLAPWIPGLLVLALMMPRDWVEVRYDVLISLTAFPLMIVLMESAVINGALRQAFSFLGDLSYPIYATHYPLLIPIGLVAKRLHHGPWSAAALMFAGTILAAIVAGKLDVLFRRKIAHKLHARFSGKLSKVSR